MSFEDIFKKSFLEGYSTIEINTATILVALFFSLILGLYIFFCYRVMTLSIPGISTFLWWL